MSEQCKVARPDWSKKKLQLSISDSTALFSPVSTLTMKRHFNFLSHRAHSNTEGRRVTAGSAGRARDYQSYPHYCQEQVVLQHRVKRALRILGISAITWAITPALFSFLPLGAKSFKPHPVVIGGPILVLLQGCFQRCLGNWARWGFTICKTSILTFALSPD